MTPDEKLDALTQQINAAEMGISKILKCPYCGELLDFSPPSVMDDQWGPPTCCAEFALAARAILERKEQQEMKDLADRIKANVGGPAVFN
mgnify:CR=1 FL=1